MTMLSCTHRWVPYRCFNPLVAEELITTVRHGYPRKLKPKKTTFEPSSIREQNASFFLGSCLDHTKEASVFKELIICECSQLI